MDKLKTVRSRIKRSWRSKVIWFNGIVCSILPLLDQLRDVLPQMREFMPDDLYKVAGWVLIAGNVVLRFMTTRPLEGK